MQAAYTVFSPIDVEIARQFLEKYHTAILDDLVTYYRHPPHQQIVRADRSLSWNLFFNVGGTFRSAQDYLGPFSSMGD